jgi:TrmH family RNA methyltransferase
LASPSVPENIGLTARILKNTSFGKLALVSPGISRKSFEVAKRARDTLENAATFSSLQEAVSGSGFVFGSTRRVREHTFVFNFEDIKHFILASARRQKISLVFGRENFGLSQAEIAACDSVFYLPADPGFPSYNLSAAVGIVCYELFNLSRSLLSFPSLSPATRKEYETFFAYLKKHLAGRVKKNRLKPTLDSLRRIFLRTHLTKNEIALLKSLLVKNHE